MGAIASGFGNIHLEVAASLAGEERTRLLTAAVSGHCMGPDINSFKCLDEAQTSDIDIDMLACLLIFHLPFLCFHILANVKCRDSMANSVAGRETAWLCGRRAGLEPQLSCCAAGNPRMRGRWGIGPLDSRSLHQTLQALRGSW